jgi:hypothetical protein
MFVCDGALEMAQKVTVVSEGAWRGIRLEDLISLLPARDHYGRDDALWKKHAPPDTRRHAELGRRHETTSSKAKEVKLGGAPYDSAKQTRRKRAFKTLLTSTTNDS